MPFMDFAGMRGGDIHVEGVGLVNNAFSAKKITRRLKRDVVDASAESSQFDLQCNPGRWNRLSILRHVGVKLRRNPFFKDGEFEGEGSIAEHAASVGSFLKGRLLMSPLPVAMVMRMSMVVGTAATSQAGCHSDDQEDRERQQNEFGIHGNIRSRVKMFLRELP